MECKTRLIDKFIDKLKIRNRCPDCLHSNFAHTKLERGYKGDWFYYHCNAVDNNGVTCTCKGYNP